MSRVCIIHGTRELHEEACCEFLRDHSHGIIHPNPPTHVVSSGDGTTHDEAAPGGASGSGKVLCGGLELPSKTFELIIADGFTVHLWSKPNWFHRFFQKLFLGFEWKDL